MNTPIKFTTAEEAVKVIKSGDHVHLSSVASAPQCLIKAMCARGEAGELKNVHVHHLHTEGPAPYADPKFEGVFQLDSLFVGANVRKVTQSGYADYIPIFLSETQKLYRSGAVPCNVAMIQVCPPDKHGYVSLGTSVDATLAAIECADHVIAVVNKYVPRAFGQAMIPLSKIDLFVQDDQPLVEAKFSEPSDVEKAIGAHCAELIEDGATLQMGIGAIPNAVLAQLGNHKNLGIHTEMFADGVLPLVRKGVINGEAKKTDPGKMVSTFLMGSQEVYNFIDDNPGVLMMDVGYTNDPYVISQNDRFVAINSAIQVDLTGQVCADSIGTKFWSGVGGQVDFVYGASLSKGGKAIIAMPSITTKGVSKIAPVTRYWSRRRYDPQPYPLAGDRERCGRPLRQDVAGARPSGDLDRPPLGTGGVGSCGVRAFRFAPPLHQGLHAEVVSDFRGGFPSSSVRPGRVIRAYGPAGANSVWEKSPIPKSDGEGRFVAGLSVRSFGAGAAKRRLASEKRAEEEEDQLPYSACLSETFDFQLSSGSRNEMTDAAIQKNATGEKS